MKLSRRLRSLAAFLALLGVLMSQLALATYACPGAQAMAMAAVTLNEIPGGAGCCGEGVPAPQPALCAAHCQQGDQSLDKLAALVVPAIPLAAILPGLFAPIEPPAAAPPGEQQSLLARATAPSVAVRHCCLRV